MLDLSNERDLIEGCWHSTSAQPQLPPIVAKYFFDFKGPMRGHFDNRRTYHRYYLRSRAIVTRGELLLGAYTKDISRQGICFLSPVQLFPKERVRLRLPNGAEYELEVARCRREAENCYDCGTRFAI